MSQPVRIIAPNLFYLITSTGTPDADIFATDETKLIIRQHIFNSMMKYVYKVLAWSIMKNHYALVVQSSNIPISKFVLRTNICYAYGYNRLNFRSGPVFANNYSCMVIQDDRVNDIIRYVHLTPVLCDECKYDELDNYRWSSHYTLIHGNPFDHLINPKEILSRFGGPNPIESYKIFMQSECQDLEIRDFINEVKKDKMNSYFPKYEMIGDDEFAEKINPGDLKSIKRTPKYIREKITLDEIYMSVLKFKHLNAADILDQKLINRYLAAQNLFAAIAGEYYNFPYNMISEYLDVPLSNVPLMISKGKRHRTFKTKLQMIILSSKNSLNGQNNISELKPSPLSIIS